MADDGDDLTWLLALLERHSRDIRWRALPEPRQAGGCTVTHEGILVLPDVGCVHAYRLEGGEAVFNGEDLDRVLVEAAPGWAVQSRGLKAWEEKT